MASVTRKSQSSRGKRRAEVRDRLLKAVEKSLAEGESFTEISVERLVSEAGISRSTFYVYFADKGDLLRAWFLEIFADVAGATQAWYGLPADADRAALRSALRELIVAYQPHTHLMAAVVDASGYDPAVRELVDAMMARNTDLLRQHIVEGQKVASINEDLHPQETAEWLTWMSERGFHQMVRTSEDEASLSRIVDAYAGIVWRALYAEARAPVR